MSKSYKDKLTNFEVQPPPAAWNSISEELKTDRDLITISTRLFNYEIVPPANAWSSIVTTLNNDKIPQNFTVTKRNKILWYAMPAAAILGAIIIGVLYFNDINFFKNKLTINTTSATNYKKNPSEEPIAQRLPLMNKPDIKENIEAPPAVILKTNKSYTRSTKELQNTTVRNLLFPGNELQIAIAAKPIRNANGTIIQNPEIINNPGSKYISITGPNGQQTKISSKFLHMLLFINDDNDIDEVEGYFDKNFLESLIWKSRFQEWRNKIINTSLVPSSTNFMDILDLKDLLMKDK